MRRNPSRPTGGNVENEERGLRPLVAFLDLALPLDEHCTLVFLSPAPAPLVLYATPATDVDNGVEYVEPEVA
jgi:hypothetical protein